MNERGDINKQLREVYRDIKKKKLDPTIPYEVESILFPEDLGRKTQTIDLDNISGITEFRKRKFSESGGNDYIIEVDDEEEEKELIEDKDVAESIVIMKKDDEELKFEKKEGREKLPHVKGSRGTISTITRENIGKEDMKLIKKKSDFHEFFGKKLKGKDLTAKKKDRKGSIESEGILTGGLNKDKKDSLLGVGGSHKKSTLLGTSQISHKLSTFGNTRKLRGSFGGITNKLRSSFAGRTNNPSFIGKSFLNRVRRMSIDSNSKMTVSKADLNLVKQVKRHETNKDVRKFLPIFLDNKKIPPKNFRTKQLIARVFLFISVFSFLMIFNLGSGFGILPYGLTIAINYIVLVIVIIKHLTGVNNLKKKHGILAVARQMLSRKAGKDLIMSTLAHWCHAFNEFSINCYFYFIFIGIFSVLFSMMFKSSCTTFTESYIGVSFSGYFTVSTQLMRMFEIEAAYKLLNPCHVYLTLPKQASTNVFVNIQLKSNQLYSIQGLYYDKSDFFEKSGYMRLLAGKPYKEAFGGDTGQRDIYSFKIGGLIPNTRYSFILNINNQNYSRCLDNKFGFDFKTLPASWGSFDEVNFVVAGSIGVTKRMQKQVKLINNYFEKDQLDLMVLGGNVAKDNGCVVCHYLWNEILTNFGDVFNHTGRIVPFIIAAGEYDIGHQSNSRLTNPGIVSDNIRETPPYILDFPQHLKGPDIPIPKERKPFFVHQFGLITLITLDSGSFFKVDDKKQLEFLESTLQQSINTLRFVLYSESLFPSCLRENSEYKYEEAYKHWGPIFDKYNVTVVFENGCNYFKRTKKIFGGKVNENGTIYIGDGNFGSEPRTCSNRKLDSSLFEKSGPNNHFWWVRHNSRGVDFKAIEIRGNEIDSFSLPLN